MATEIKFRAWDKDQKVMHQIFDSTQQTEWFLPNLHERFEIMQYTGLKDKNSKDIYVGDILRITCNFELRKGIEVDVVKIWNCSFLCSDWLFHELIDNGAKGKQEWEVIGNIFENAELMKK